MTEELIKDILRYIDDNLYESIKVETISNKYHFDRSYLSRSFKKITGISLIDYINERKIIKTIYDIINTDEKILKIALSHGYNSLEYFSETFYRVTNFSPTSLRSNEYVKDILPFIEDKDLLNCLKFNHDKILKIRTLDKPKSIVYGSYKKIS